MNSEAIDLIYELSPMQQAMLFHSLYAPGSGVYVLQLSLRLTGRLDLRAFERAWQLIVDRHDILRTAFFWEGMEKPVQVVYRQAALEVKRESWRGLDPAAQRVRLARFLDADREKGFDLAVAPLMRVMLLELGADVYQVVWTQHHLVVDGWSQGQVLRELFAAYAAFVAGSEPGLPAVRGYREYISWLQRQDLGQAEAFWRRTLAGFDSPTWIAGADGKAEGPAWQDSGERELALPAAASRALAEAARRHALTLNTLVQGAWALFLAKETGASNAANTANTADIVFGTTVAGRPPGLAGVESIVGPFINTLPLRAEVRPGLRLWEWLGDLQERQVEMRRFEHSPLVEVQRWSALPAGVRLFDHIVVFENQALAGGPAGEAAQVPGLTITAEGGSSLTNYPLNLIVLPGATLTLMIRYDTSRFTATAVARMMARLENLLGALATDEDLALEDVPQISEAERHQIVVEWGRPAEPSSGDTLQARFEDQARRTPGAVAATHAGTSLTYAELSRRANQLAWHLRAMGVGPEERVGLCGERSLELLEGILGIVKAGGAYVPLDPRYPSDRLAYMAEDAGVRVVVGTEDLISGMALERVALDALRPHLDTLPVTDPPVVIGSASLAYVIYTSGSTGRPKGVQVTHGNVVRLFDATDEWFGFGPADVWTLFHSYAFDFSVWEIWGALLHGGRVVVVPWEVSRAPEQLMALLAAEKITVLNQTPSAFAQLARVDAERGGVPASLRLVIFGGEALDVGSLTPWFARHGDRRPRLVNMYGITETTVHVTYRPLSARDTGGSSVIGERIPDLGLYLLDPSLQPMPIGVAGEIAVGGAGLARGYLGRPELTAERFVPDGLSGLSGARLYRSGDLGRFLPDGDVEYLGRIDHQVKIRGFRIELGEIEAVLASHPAVRECVVLARQDAVETPGRSQEKSDVRLVAYLIAKDPASQPAPEELRAHLRATLPDHMVPAAFVWLPALTLTQNGKIDRKALPAPEGLRAAESDYVPPADAVEERLAEIWSEVLRVERVGAHHDFFALGGHSLLATQVASRLREAFGLEIPLRGLFEAPTVAGLAEVIDEQAEQAAAAIDLTALLDDLDHLSDDEAAVRLDDPRALRSMARAHLLGTGGEIETSDEDLPAVPAAPVALPRQAGENRFPLSFAQQRLWFLDQLEPDSPAYNVPLPVRLRGELPAAQLARVAAELVRRHETLRTTFQAVDGQPVQVVHHPEAEPALYPTLSPTLSMIDLSALPDAAREASARALVHLDAWQPFDLRRGPLLRLRLLKLAPRDHMLLLTLHHIVSDGWSMRVLLREVAALFGSARLPDLEFQYADFAVWQRAWLQGRVLDEQLAFWKRQLAEAPAVLEIPTDRPRPAVQTFRGASIHRTLEPAVAAAVRALCRREDVTPFMALVAAWALLLGRHAGQSEVVLGTPVAGRHVRGSEHLIGFFANTLVLRVDLQTPSCKTLLAHSRRMALDAFSHQDIPFERLVEELVPVRDLSRSPLFQAMFVLHSAGGEGWRIPGLAVDPVPLAGITAKFDLLLTMVDLVDGGFACTLEYSTDLFAAERMKRLLENFTVLLAGAAAEPEIPLLELPMVSAAERRRLLADWNSDQVDFPRVCVHWPVEEQAERTPDELAVVWSRVEHDGTVTADATGGLTYRELNRRANQLAHHLRALGVVADDRVAICLERSVAMTVAVLAVLKAGAAYVPLDPDYPADRVAYMLDDSRSRALVTTSDLAARLPATAAQRVLLDGDSAVIAARSDQNPRVPLAPDNLIYVIYTSGSTGRPKGVAMPHGVLSNLMMWQRGKSSAGVGTRTIQFASLSFDASFHEMFSTWWTGGTLVGVSQETRRDPVALCAVLRSWDATRLFVPFVALQALAEAIDLGAPPPTGLREIFTAGEQLRITRQIRTWLDASGAWLENQYGPSEGHVVTAHRLEPPATSAVTWPDLPPIGRPLPNVPMFLLDRSLEPVPQGAVGQLYFGGAQVVRGYLDRPDLTAEKHIPDPFSNVPGARLYATGDHVRYLENGAIQFLGRIDQQVKIRGFRVEPGEVESALSRHPAVRAAVVVVRGLASGQASDQSSDRALVAYYVADGPLASGELAAFLKKDLPEYMVPAVLVRLDALPLTPSGKVDRKALPAPAAPEEDLLGRDAPADPVEEILAAIWAEVLHRERVGVHEDFFALGGHSLLATQVASRIRRTLGVELPLRQLFETPTVAGYARAVRTAGRTGAASIRVAPPILPIARDRELPLSFAQQRLWLIDQLEPGSAAYNLPLAVRLSGEVSAGLLEKIFAGIVRRHEVLRTTFWTGETGPVQIIAEPWRPAIHCVDLSRFLDGEARARKLALEEARRPFDFARGPLFRLALLRLADEEHVLLLTMHHIVTDGWSMGVMLREIAALHEGTALPDLAVQYADFAVWQRSWLSGAVLDEQITFWKERLAGAPHVLELPTDRPRPGHQTLRGAGHPVSLPPVLSEAVRVLCRQRGATPFMALLAAWGLLLARHAGQDDVLIGTPIAGRNHREIEDLIGFFVNTLVLRVDLRADDENAITFSDLLLRVRAMALDAYAHQDLPFERLVEELVPERDLARSQLFQALFVLQNAPAGELRLPGLSLAPVEVESGIAKFDLTLALSETPNGMGGVLEHNADLFDASTAARLVARFAALLEAAAGDPERSLRDLPVLLPAERHQALLEWNDAATAYPREASLPELFAAVARAHPDAPAIVVAGKAGKAGDDWTYARLDAASDRLARRLRALGVGAGGGETAVGIAMERSPELIVGTLAILKAGGVYVPLDSKYPDERLAFMLADTGAEIVLVHERTRERMAGRGRLVGVGEEEDNKDNKDNKDSKDSKDGKDGKSNWNQQLAPAAGLAYVIYTSGSTGRPKGVAVPQRAIVRLVRDTNYVALGPGDRIGHVANISFDAATYEIWGALLTGAAVVVIPREVVLAPSEFAVWLRAWGVTSMFLTSALFTKMAREAPGAFATLRELLVGGEAVDPAAARAVLADRPPLRLLNGYGPTESTTFAAWHPIRSVPAGAAAIPIGGPLSNTTLYVLDRMHNAVPPGVVGELCIGGDGLARGYLNRPELTAERFIPHPWGLGERLYRSGDLVRHRADHPDGAVEYLGRLDNQVKIRGFRIEPGEIETVLAALPGVRECAVVSDTAPNARLAAYVVPAAGVDLTADGLRADLKQTLPDYMLPAAVVFLDALPLTANGKLDRRALPQPEVSRPADRFVAPEDEVERQLALIWEELLDVRPVGAHDDFFALGGHSLLATQVMSRIRAVLGVDLPLRQLFEHPTVAGLAAAVRSAGREARLEAPPIIPVLRADGMTLSFAQQRLWFLDQLDPASAAYNIPLAVRLSGELAVDLLERIFREVVRRHEALRTTFALRDGKPVQVIAPPDSPLGRPEVAVLDLADAPEDVRAEWSRRFAQQEAQRPFSLERGPLLRLSLIRLGEREHLLLITFHHIVSDGWSIGVLLREIAALYGAFSQGTSSPLPELPVQYADFASWQRAWLQGEPLERQLRFWRERLAGAPTLLELPTDRPRPAVQTFHGASAGVALPPALSDAVQALCQSEGVTPFMALLAAWAILLGRHANQDDVTVGTPIAGRNRREIEDLIGFFVNTLVIRVRLEATASDTTEGPGFAALLGQMRETSLGAFTHQDLPFERLVEELVPERHLSHAPLFQAAFALQNAPGERLSVPGLTLSLEGLENQVAKFDLSLMLWQQEAGFAGALEYNTDLFDATTAERLVARFTTLLDAAVREPGRPVGALPLLPEAERQQAIVEWNDAASTFPREASIPELFAAWVAVAPESPALIDGDTIWSYRRLDQTAERLARRLRALGVGGLGRETAVAISMERSPELIAGILAILKAGGVYVPLDASYPDERLDFMLADCGAEIVLVHGRTRERMAGRGVLVEVGEEEGSDRSDRSDRSVRSVPAASLAVVIYTSGSTGRPKGVALAHRGVVRLVRESGFLRLGPGDRMAHMSNISFDGATLEIWGALLNGAALALLPREVALAPADLAARLARDGVTATVLTTALFNQVAREAPQAFSVLRTVIFGGEAADPAAVALALASGGPERLIHLYGPAEGTTGATWQQVREVPAGAVTVPIGLPVSNTSVYLLDRRRRPVPPGAVGEVFIGGDGLARGYLNRPELTAERFVPHLRERGERLYRTGDLARQRPGGALEFVGRADDQVKIRGFRIELGEIETVLSAHPAVGECIVMAREDTPGIRLLAAYVVPSAAPLEESSLRAFVAERLPGFMVPSAFVLLDSLPLTPNGKVDRRALPAPDRARGGGEVFEEPSDPVEILLAGIWAEVLGLDRVGRHDNFFALGGHSMLATQIVARIRSLLHVELPLRALFEAATLAELAVAVRAVGGGVGGEETDKDIKDCKDIKDEGQKDEQQKGEEVVAAPPVRPWRAVSIRLAGLSAEKRQLLDAILREQRAEAAPSGSIPPREDLSAPVPLSFSQERMWFLHQLDPASAVYNVFLGVRLAGELRAEILAAAFSQLVRRHQVLATRYETAAAPGNRAVQVIDVGESFPLPRIDLSGLGAERRKVELDRLQAEESGRPFDLIHGPVMRARVVHQEPGEHALLLTIHHIAADGWSLGILLPELAALYAGLSEGKPAGEPSPLPSPRLQYADFAVWQRRWLRGDALEAQLGYWRRQLAPPLPVLSLPTDRPRGTVATSAQGFRLATERLTVPAALTADLHALGNGRGASLFMVLLTGLAAVLQRSGGDERILIGTPVAGRNRRELEELAGMFLNTLVLRVDLDGDPDFGGLLQTSSATALEAFAHQDLPLETLLQELRIERGLRGPFQAMLLLQNLQPLRVEVPGLTLTSLGAERHVDLGTAVFEIGLTVEEHGGELQASLSYNAMLFDAATMHRLLIHLRTLLAGAVADPATRLSSLPLLAPEEQRQVAAWNESGAVETGLSVPALFEEQAARTPAAEAVRQAGVSLTYGQLDLRSRAIAERLRAFGVGPEVPVAVFLERSPALIAALLGVLRAGGVYAPLDPAFPAERLAWILGDLKPAVLLTEGALAGRIPWEGKVLLVDEEPSSVPAGRSFPAPEPGQAAYVIYTSGSTGRPKGVLVSHGALSGFVAAAKDLYGITAQDRVLQLASVGFDASVEEIYPCLTTGGTLVLRTDEMAGTIDGFLRGCAEQGVTVLDLPTAFWHELVVSPELERQGLPASVRLVILGGERPLPERVAAWLRHTDPRVRLFNTYGPTEATVVATAAELTPALAAEAWREVPMGRPLAGARAYVLDGSLRPVPVGIPAELYLGGTGIARGYLGRPDLTAERFLPNPAGARLYRTGDLARRRPDGGLEFAGRADAQVKIRGFRVEPGEIESVLAAAPDVAESAVVAVSTVSDNLRDGDLRLVAYVVPALGKKMAAADLRAFLDSRLPAWMVPAAFVSLPALPRTATGKIDRRALPAPDGFGGDLERPYVAPRNDVEEIIAEIWREALGVERVSVHDSFFELGGHSLLLLQVMRRLREAFDLEIPLRAIYEERTVEALAQKVEELLIEEISKMS